MRGRVCGAVVCVTGVTCGWDAAGTRTTGWAEGVMRDVGRAPVEAAAAGARRGLTWRCLGRQRLEHGEGRLGAAWQQLLVPGEGILGAA